MALVAAGAGAGIINAVVGSGTLLTYPVLLAVGLSPVTANGTNTTGLSPGAFSAAIGYRRELAGRRRRLVPLVLIAAVAGVTGSLLVVALPAKVFGALVPWLIGGAALLVAVQPLLVRALQRRAPIRSVAPAGPAPDPIHLTGADGNAVVPAEAGRPGPALSAGVFGAALYGGYFGAAQGVVLMAVLGTLDHPDPQRANAAKNLLGGTANLAAAIVFAVTGKVVWIAALLVAIGSIAGGWLGAHVARQLSPVVLRALVVLVGVAAAIVAVRAG